MDMFDVRIIKDSVTIYGERITTMEWTYPRIILAEVDTHRRLSRNSASSRAIPFKKILDQVTERPFVPDRFPINGPGMQPCAYVTDTNDLIIVDEDALKGRNLCSYQEYRRGWLNACDAAIASALDLANLGVHKEIVNRILEPYQWTTTVITATNWINMFAQRCHPAAQWQFQKVARMAWKAYRQSKPTIVNVLDWHQPYVDDEDIQACGDDKEKLCKVSAARCATVSYHRQGEKRDHDELIERVFMRLIGGGNLTAPGHWSPLEHVATPWSGNWGNLAGWQSLRYHYNHDFDEADFVPEWL